MQRMIQMVAMLVIPLVFQIGCTTTGSTTVGPKDFSDDSGNDDAAKVAALVPGDAIEVSVEIDGRMEVVMHRAEISHLGKVTLPLVGDVDIGGLTIEESRTVVAKIYGAYFVNPPVVMISRMGDSVVGEWGFVTVTGKVGQPGRIKIQSAKGIRLTTAIQESGGFASSAKMTAIKVSRTEKDGRKIHALINFNDIGQDGSVEADVSLFDGDIIYVPQRIL